MGIKQSNWWNETIYSQEKEWCLYMPINDVSE